MLTAEEMIDRIQEILWLDSRLTDENKPELFMNPDKEWDAETSEDIARVLIENDRGPEKP